MTDHTTLDAQIIEAQILETLRASFDPEIPLNIVDLGLVQSISLHLDEAAPGHNIPGVPHRYRAQITLLTTSPDDALRAQLSAQILNALAGLPAISHASLTLLDTPTWSPTLISPAGRRILKLDQPQFPILNNRLR